MTYEANAAPQEIVWLDEAWLFDCDNDPNSDFRLGLLHDYATSTSDDGDKATTMYGCVRFLRTIVNTSKSNSASNAVSDGAATKTTTLSKLLNAGKSIAGNYSALKG